jgi:hypothetical protein
MDKLMAFLTILFPFLLMGFIGVAIGLVPWLQWPAYGLGIIGGAVYFWNRPPWKKT